jgi:hypothetical protein
LRLVEADPPRLMNRALLGIGGSKFGTIVVVAWAWRTGVVTG